MGSYLIVCEYSSWAKSRKVYSETHDTAFKKNSLMQKVVSELYFLSLIKRIVAL